MHVQVSAPSVFIDSWSGHANEKKTPKCTTKCRYDDSTIRYSSQIFNIRSCQQNLGNVTTQTDRKIKVEDNIWDILTQEIMAEKGEIFEWHFPIITTIQSLIYFQRGLFGELKDGVSVKKRQR